MKSILAYEQGTGLSALIIFLLGVLICIGLFLALRALVLWYWKVDQMVSNQQTQIQLLRELLNIQNRP